MGTEDHMNLGHDDDEDGQAEGMNLQATSVKCLHALTGLRELDVSECKKIRDLKELRRMRELNITR